MKTVEGRPFLNILKSSENPIMTDWITHVFDKKPNRLELVFRLSFLGKVGLRYTSSWSL